LPRIRRRDRHDGRGTVPQAIPNEVVMVPPQAAPDFVRKLDLVGAVPYSGRNGFCRAPGLFDSLSRRAQACVL